MTGLITCSDPILCKKEVLGEIFDTTIADIDVSIHFPRYPDFDKGTPKVGFTEPLLSPQISNTWTRGGDPLRWGYPMRYPSGDSAVEMLALSVECEEAESPEKARILYKEINSWGKSFFNYLHLSTKQCMERDKNNENKAQCWLILRGLECLPDAVTATLYVNVPTPDSFASKQHIIDALQFASSKKELHLEYQMLLSAYEARKECHNRQAIIDACSAVELCLENNISCRTKKLEMNPQFFLEKFNSLGDKFDIIKQLDKTFPKKDHQKIIVKPRNDIAHNRDGNQSFPFPTPGTDVVIDTIVEFITNTSNELLAREKIPEFFSHYDELLRTANKFIHKQGFDSFYGYYRWGKNDVESKRTDLFVDLLKHAIGMVLIMNIALDPLSLALSDPNVDSHIPFDVMTEPIPVHIFEEFLSPEIINKIKETDHYQAVKQYFMEMEELSEPTYMVVRCQHFNCSALSEIIAQEHLLNIYERLMLRILQNGIPVTRFYTDDSMLGYSTSINPIKRITHFSSNQFDPFIRDEDTINFSWNGMYISVFACLDTHLIVQHNHEFDGNAIQTIKEQIRIFNQQFQSLLDTFKSNS